MPLSKKMSDSPFVQPMMTTLPLTNTIPKEAESEIRVATAQFVSNAANVAGLVRSATHEQPLVNQHITLVKTNIVGPLSHDSKSEQSQPSSTGKQTVLTAPPAQLSDAAELSRQAVFTEIEQKAEMSVPLPTYLEKHRVNALGLAIVAIAGQFLVQKHQHLTTQSQTCQIPPRRRGSVN
jgi:hypothetical protein